MSKNKVGTYYLSRVIKHGILDTDKLLDAILNPIPIAAYGHAWTFIDAKVIHKNNSDFIYGKLCKYSPEAEVTIIDPDKSREVRQEEPNLSVASSPFVYIPEYSGIAFLRVSNHIEPKTFMKRFGTLIDRKYYSFFVKCEVEPIADLRSFAVKLSKLNGIYSISANVSPPNPLFGPLWEELKIYLEKRRTDKMKIQEDSLDDRMIETNLPSIMKKVADSVEEKSFLDQKLDIGDAAILMAADGYGSGYVKGKKGGDFITIRTSETIKNFPFLKDPKPESLFEKANKLFKKIKEDRHMRHDEK